MRDSADRISGRISGSDLHTGTQRVSFPGGGHEQNRKGPDESNQSRPCSGTRLLRDVLIISARYMAGIGID